MKKKVIATLTAVILALGTFSAIAFAEAATEPATEPATEAVEGKSLRFRGFEWGATVDEVIEKEITSSMKENQDWVYQEDSDRLLILNGKVSSYDTGIVFEFEDKHLVGGMYLLDVDHSNENQYYYDFEDLCDKYEEVYGKPDVDKFENWKGSLYKDKPDKIGMAIITGDLQVGSMWYGDDGSEITVFIYGDNYDASISIKYDGPEYQASSNTDGI